LLAETENVVEDERVGIPAEHGTCPGFGLRYAAALVELKQRLQFGRVGLF
jgi:hypothetical protein